MAATDRTTIKIVILNAPIAAKVPAANNKESPGRKGVNTKPVSANIMTNPVIYSITSNGSHR